MADLKNNDRDGIASWGFRLMVNSDELVVTRDTDAYDPRQKKKRLFMICCAVFITLALYVGALIRLERAYITRSVPDAQSDAINSNVVLGPLDIVLTLIWPSLPLLWALYRFYPPVANLRCTKESLQITSAVLGKMSRVRQFAVKDVRRIQYVVSETDSLFGLPRCLGFLVSGKQVTCLTGLRRNEAKRILDQLQRMGFDVVCNPEVLSASPLTKA